MSASRTADVAQTPSTLEHAPVVTSAGTVAPAHVERHEEASALGLTAPAWVALSMLVVIALLIWKRVPAIIGRALDTKIEGIRSQLDEATRLRAEAEGLKAEYTAKAAAAAAEADAMLAGARAEAEGIVAKAQADASALIERRGRMAEDKIAAAERAAVAEVRTRAATAATAAAASLIAQRYDALADRALVSRTINELGSARLS